MRPNQMLFFVFLSLQAVGQNQSAPAQDEEVALKMDAIRSKIERLENEKIFNDAATRAGAARSQVLNSFRDGTPASADEVNENFLSLETDISYLYSAPSYVSKEIDCTNDPAALEVALKAPGVPGERKGYLIKGKCEIGVNFVYGSTYIGGTGSGAEIVANAEATAIFGFPVVAIISVGTYVILQNVTIDNPLLESRRSGSLRLIDVTFTEESILAFLLANSASYLELYGRFTQRGLTAGIELNDGSTGLVRAVDLAASMYLQNGSSGRCSPCENGGIDLSLNTNSSFYVNQESPLTLRSLEVLLNSSFVQNSGCKDPSSTVTVDATSIAEWINCDE